MAADENRNAFVRIGASFMATGEALNPFRSDSNLRQGAQQFQQGMAEGRENMKAAPPGVRHIGQFAMGMGSVGAAPLTSLAGVGELGDSVQQVGPVQTVKNMGTGFVTHIKETPVSELAGEALGGWATGKAMMDTNPAGASAKMTKVTSWADTGTVPDLNPGRWVMKGGPTKLNYLNTGLGGPKIDFTKKFPFIKSEPSKSSFSNSITGEVPSSSLKWPPGWEKVKGVLGQRKIEGGEE